MHVLSRVQFFVTPRTVAHQDPLAVEFYRQEYWSELPLPIPGDLPDPGTELESASPAWAAVWKAQALCSDAYILYSFKRAFFLGLPEFDQHISLMTEGNLWLIKSLEGKKK